MERSKPTATGIYYLSQQIARAAYTAIVTSANGSGTGKITNDDFFAAAASAWASSNVGDLFPGNLISGNWSDLDTPGAVAALAATPYAVYLGKTSTDFDAASIVNLGNGVSVAIDDEGRTQAVFASTPEDLEVLAGSVLLGGQQTTPPSTIYLAV